MAKMGQPLLYNNCLDLDMDCELYFESCHYVVDEWGDVTGELRETPVPYTITGLAMALNTSRMTLLNYQKRDDYFYTIKRHKIKVENYAEARLFTGKATGPIFALKNFDWKDKSEQDLNVSGPVKINIKHTQEPTD